MREINELLLMKSTNHSYLYRQNKKFNFSKTRQSISINKIQIQKIHKVIQSLSSLSLEISTAVATVFPSEGGASTWVGGSATTGLTCP